MTSIKTLTGAWSRNRRLSTMLYLAALHSYVHLWILEGAVRKWTPGLENLMYIGRDALFVTLSLAIVSLLPPRKNYAGWFLAIAVFSFFCLSISIYNSVPAVISIIGIRSYVAPVLFCLIMWLYAPNLKDAAQAILRIVLFYVPIQAAVVLIQVLSLPGSFVNRQVGGEAAHFVNVDVVRASGTFSSPSGLTSYLPIALAASLIFMLKPGVGRSVFSSACLAFTVFITLASGSRGAVFLVTAVVMAYLFWAGKSLRWRHLRISALLICGVTLLASIANMVIPAVINSFTHRFEEANEQEDTVARIWEQTVGFANYLESLSGVGPGVHSQAGISRGSGYDWIEIDSIRWVAELGIIGYFLAFMRLAFALIVLYRLITVRGIDSGPEIIIASVLFPVLLAGTITQTPSHQAAFSITMFLYVAWFFRKNSWPSRRIHTDVSSRLVGTAGVR